jgi:signal transduction histidine kinase
MQMVKNKISNIWEKYTLSRLKTKLSIAFSLLAILISGVLTFASYLISRDKSHEDIRQRIRDIVSIAALQIDGDLHATLLSPEQESSPAYIQIKGVLQHIRNTVPDIRFVYTWRKNPNGQLVFVVDAETNPSEISHLGEIYDSGEPVLLAQLAVLDRVMVDEKFTADKWGVWLSGYAPFYKSDGRMEGILGMDIKASDVLAHERLFLWDALAVFLGTLPLTLLLGLWFGRRLAEPIVKLTIGSERITQGDLSYRVSVKGSYETNALAQSFNKMTDTLQKAIIYRDKELNNRKKTEVALDAANKDLQENVQQLSLVNRELAEFAHIIAHDLRTPLRGIGILAEWLANDYADRFDEEGRNRIALLVERTQRMYDQITSILRYSEIDMGTQQMEQIDLNELVRQITADIRLPENIQITIADRLPVLVGEKGCLTQVFRNLLSNAVKYIDKPQGRITIGCVSENGFWRFSIADNGIGIEKKYFDKIFKIFQSLGGDKSSKSTGMGLAIVKKAVEKHGGRIWVESTPGQGTSFFFTLQKRTPEVVVIEPEHQANISG